ncbi:MAG: hypothetical protein A3H27_13655 [Acidobacteria bacterium RIFCSPLOWO2_02_FULL_59_13]|nr:MAG: hypothetical protein A3H27_13655 [Acidobacteria bacterium RIFCSPLOWO2_02_FULL_59_13]
MEPLMKSRTLLVLATAALLSTSVLAQTKKTTRPTIEGVWRVVEVTGGPNDIKNSNPQPALYVFTRKHYGHVGTFGGPKPRPDLPDDLTKASAAELLAVLGAPFAASAGTYELAPDTVTFRPIVAKLPRAMAPGATIKSAYKLDRTTLMLTQISAPLGPVAKPFTFKLARVE